MPAGSDEKPEREIQIPHQAGLRRHGNVTTGNRGAGKELHAEPPFRRTLGSKEQRGVLVLGLDMRIVNAETGKDVKWDGKDMGEIWFRGPWIADEYYKEPERSKQSFIDGWFHTGDVGTIDEEGYVRLVDRTRDLLKSGGEWISSVDLENIIMAHPNVMEAAIIGVPDPKWQEVPLACIVVKPGQTITPQEMQEFLKDKVKAAYWIPKIYAFLDALPKTSVLKFDKEGLRKMFADGQLEVKK